MKDYTEKARQLKRVHTLRVEKERLERKEQCHMFREQEKEFKAKYEYAKKVGNKEDEKDYLKYWRQAHDMIFRFCGDT